MSAVMTLRAAGTTALETRTATGTPTAPIIGPTAGTMVATIIAAAVIAVASTTAIRALEAGSRIAANAGGITRKILARLGSTGTRSAGFAGEEDSIVFDTDG